MAGRPDQNLLVTVEDGVCRLVLNRPERHNAFDDALIAALDEILVEIEGRVDIRAVVLTASGDSFCAGADLGWMKRAAGYTGQENREDAGRLADMLARLAGLSRPTLALVQGNAFGGGLGLIAACDIAIAARDARFALSEVRLGLIPSVISPYVLRAIGRRAAQRYFLTAERFDAEEARRLGLVHEAVPAGELAAAGDRIVDALKLGGPVAIAEAKRLIADVAGRPIDRRIIDETARRIAEVRGGAEGREGVAAFLERRKPVWRSE